jgi:hypothetical protein
MPLNPNRPAPGQPREYHFPPFSHRTLDNGLTAWVVPLPGRAMVSVSLIVDGGAATETEEQGHRGPDAVAGHRDPAPDANDFAIASEQLARDRRGFRRQPATSASRGGWRMASPFTVVRQPDSTTRNSPVCGGTTGRHHAGPPSPEAGR